MTSDSISGGLSMVEIVKPNMGLAIDDPKFREANTKRLLDNVEKVGNAFVRGQKLGRWMTIYIIIVIGIIMFTICGLVLTILIQGGTDNFLDNFFPSESIGLRYYCWTDSFNVTYRSTFDIKNFKEVWPDGNCLAYRLQENGG